MYTVVRNYKIKEGAFDQLVQSLHEGFLTIISSVPGFVAYYFVNTGKDTVVTVSIFEDQGGAYQSIAAAAAWIKEHVSTLVEGPPTIMAGDTPISLTK